MFSERNICGPVCQHPTCWEALRVQAKLEAQNPTGDRQRNVVLCKKTKPVRSKINHGDTLPYKKEGKSS